MARLPQPGLDNGTWGAILNDFLSQSLTSNGTLKDGVVTASALASDAISSSTLNTTNTAANGQVLSYNGTDLTWVTPPTAPVTSVNSQTGAVVLTKADVGLSNVDNTSDANKPISTATQTALNNKLTAGSNLSDLTSASTARTNLGLASAATMTTAQIAADSALTSTFARVTQASFRAGRIWMFAGDSITNGSAASNFTFSYTRQACHMVGTLHAASDSIEAGRQVIIRPNC